MPIFSEKEEEFSGVSVMEKIDLKPLSKENIEELGIPSHDLWIIKVGEEILGPFESESLKQYAAQNETLFDKVTASRLEHSDWHPFFSHALFQRRGPQSVPAERVYEGPFWIMAHGQKSAPFSQNEINKKIDMGLLTMTDVISCDDGHSWRKVYQLTTFERRSHRPSDLPKTPRETSFESARLELIENLELRSQEETVTAEDGMASLAYLSKDKKNIIKIDEITLDIVQETEVSRSLKWAIPVAITGCLALVLTGAYVFSPSTYTEESIAEIPETIYPIPQQPQQVPNPFNGKTQRRPASTGSLIDHRTTPAIENPQIHHSQFPTHIETHNNTYEPEPMEYDPTVDPLLNDRGLANEPSLVQPTAPVDNEMTVDEAMNSGNIPVPDQPPEAPVIEEASDF